MCADGVSVGSAGCTATLDSSEVIIMNEDGAVISSTGRTLLDPDDDPHPPHHPHPHQQQHTVPTEHVSRGGGVGLEVRA